MGVLPLKLVYMPLCVSLGIQPPLQGVMEGTAASVGPHWREIRLLGGEEETKFPVSQMRTRLCSVLLFSL